MRAYLPLLPDLGVAQAQRTPALDELCSRYGDPTNRKIYMMSRDVEGRWLDLHERATGTKPPID